jgi:large subunit ribosomal protein L4e
MGIAVDADQHALLACGLCRDVVDIETLEKTTKLVAFLEKIELGAELKRVSEGVRINGGKSGLRGRAYKTRVGPLIVVTNDRGVGRAASAVPGVEVVKVDSVNVTQLAPGGVPGRLTIWTESAMGTLAAMNKEES